MSVLIDNPSPKQPLNPIGLFSCAPPNPLTGTDKSGNPISSALCQGLAYHADACDLSCAIPVDPCNQIGEACFPKPAEGGRHFVYSCQTGALAVENCDTCNTYDSLDERRAAVIRDLIRTRSHKVEWSLSTGTNLTPASCPGAPDPVAGQPFSCFGEPEVLFTEACNDIVGAISQLGQYQASCTTAQGILHIPYAVLPHMQCCGLAIPDRSGRLFDVYGNKIVVGSGYSGYAPDGTPPDPGAAWIYMTGPVNIWETDITTLEDVVTKDAEGQIFNQSVIRAEQGYVVTVDPCCFAAMPISVGGCK